MNMTKNITSEQKTDPYDNKVFEYDTTVDGPEWYDFITYMNDFDYDKAECMDSDDFLKAMYKRKDE